MVIGVRSGKRPAFPEHLHPQPANMSRLLRGAEYQHNERNQIQAPSVSLRTVRSEVGRDV